MDKKSDRNSSFRIYFALVLFTLAVFGQVRNYDFVDIDDYKYVCENEYVKGGLTHNSIVWAFTSDHASNWHPLTWLSHMLDCQLFGLEPGWHHLTNLLLHIISTLLLFGVLKKMTGATWQSAFVAALFALHPLHVESVAWISERKDVLSTVFWMLTMAAYVRYVERRAVGWYLLMLLAFALGLMAKPMLVTLPFVLLLLDYWPLGRISFGGPEDKDDDKAVKTYLPWQSFFHLVREKIPFFILTAVSSVITYTVQQRGGAIATIEKFPLSFRIRNAIMSYSTYINKTIWPNDLAVFYNAHVIVVVKAIASAAVLLAISILIIYLSKKHRYLLVGWLWYIGTLVPVIGLVQVGHQAYADRYTYIPLIGLFIIITWGVPDFLHKSQHRRVTLVTLAVIVLSSLSVCTYFQQSYWRNSITLFNHTLNVTKDNYWIHFSLANLLLKQNKLEEAESHFLEADRITLYYPRLYYSMGVLMHKQGRITEAIEYFNLSVKNEPDDFESHYNLGILLSNQGEYEQAINHIRKAVKLRPDSAEMHCSLGFLLSYQGQTDEAIREYRAALEINPNLTQARTALNTILAEKQTRPE